MTLPVYYLIDDELLSVPQIIEKYKECRQIIKKLEDSVERLENDKKELEEITSSDNMDIDSPPKRKRGRPRKEKAIEIKIKIPSNNK